MAGSCEMSRKGQHRINEDVALSLDAVLYAGHRASELEVPRHYQNFWT